MNDNFHLIINVCSQISNFHFFLGLELKIYIEISHDKFILAHNSDKINCLPILCTTLNKQIST